MPIISKETWDKFTQEEKTSLRRLYSNYRSIIDVAEGPNYHPLAVKEYEILFGKENLQPHPLTYEDVAEELFDGEDTFYISDIGSIVLAEGGRLIYDKYKLPNNCTSHKQAEKLLAINKLLNVAKFLNKDWEPDWEKVTEAENKWYIMIDLEGNINTSSVLYTINAPVYFRTEELAKQAIQILGEDTVRLALGNF